MRMDSARAAPASAKAMATMRLMRTERILDPLQIAVLDEHAIESARRLAVARQPMAGGEDQPRLLGRRDAGARAAVAHAGARPDLDEDDAVAVAADEVD